MMLTLADWLQPVSSQHRREWNPTMTTERNERDDQRGIRAGWWPTRIDTLDLVVLVVLAWCGWGLWAWAASRTDAEAWDHESYWSIVLPAMALLSAAAGWLRPNVAVVVGAALVLPQAMTLFATSGVGPLAIVGIVFFIVLALSFTGVALVAARFRDRGT